MKKWSDVTADPRYQSAAPELQERIRNDFFTNVIAPDIPEDVDASEIRRQFDLKTDPMLEKPTFLGAVKDRALENRKLGLDMIDSVFGEEKSVVAGKGMDNTPAIERRGGPLSEEGFAKVKGTFENADAASRDSLTNRPGAIGNAARKVDESYQQADAKAPNRVTDRRIESREKRLLQDGLTPETARAVSAQGGDVNTISKITPGIPDREIVDYALDTVRDVAKIAPQTGKMVIDTARLSGEYIPIVGDILTRASAEASAAIEEISKGQSPELQAKSRELQMLMQTGDRAQVTAFLAKNPSVMSSIAIPSAGSMLVAAGPGIALRAIGASAEAATTATVASNALMNAGSAFSEAQGDPVARYTAALIAGGGTLLIGRLTEGGAEGAIARGLSGGGNVASRLAEGAKIAGREYAQEFVEGGSEATGTQVADVMSGTRDSINPQQILNQAQVEGAAGLLLGGGVGMLQTMQQDQKQQATEEAKAALDAIPNANTVDEAIALFNETIKAPITVNTPPLFQEPITNAVPEEAIDAAELVDGLPAEGEPDVSLANDITPVPAGAGGLESDLGTGSVGDRPIEQPGDAAALDGSIRPDEPVLRNGSGDAAVTFANAQEGQIVESGGQQFRKVGNGFERVDANIEQSAPVESQIQPDMNVNEAPNITRAKVEPPAPDTVTGEKISREWTAFADDSGTRGIPRSEMPQIKAEHRGALTNFLNARGISHEQDEVPASTLKPTQAEFSPGKVQKAKDFDGGDRSILVSADGHVLDGHHQWLAKLDEDATVPVIRLNAPIKKLLTEVSEFPSAETAGGAVASTSQVAEAAPTQTDTANPQQIAYIGSKNSKQVLTAEPFGTDGKHLAVKLNGDFIYDFESGDEVTVPVDATLDDIKKAVKKSGQFNGKTIITYNKGYAPQGAVSQPFDSESFDKAREIRIKESKESGNTHLDQVPAYVETMRGKAIYYVHDPKVRGVVRTVDNRGNVYVDWSDKYSADKELASPSQEKRGKKSVTVYRTSLGTDDLKDYVLGNGGSAAKPVSQPKTENAPEAKQDNASAIPEIPTSDVVQVVDIYGRTHSVRQGDLDGNADRIPTVRKNGDVISGEEIPRSIIKAPEQPGETAEDARKAEIEIARSNRAKAMIAERMKLNPSTDDLFAAMAKLGGLKKDDAVSEFGLDPADLGKYRSGILFSFTNGKRALTPDGMREALAQYGYDVGDTVAEFGDKLDNAIRGIQQERTQEDAVTEKIKAFEESQQEYSEAYDALSEADQETVDEIVDAAIAAIGDAQVSVIMTEVATENPGESVNTAFFRTQLKERINDHIAAQEARKQAGADAETEAGRTAENRGGESSVSPDDRQEVGADLFGDNTATRQSIADAARAKDTKRNSGESNPDDFALTGSDRAADQAITRGARDLFDQPDEVSKAKEALDAAGVTGTDKLNTIAQVRDGKLTAEEVAEAHGVSQWDAMPITERQQILAKYFGPGTDGPERYATRKWDSFNVGEKSSLQFAMDKYGKQDQSPDLDDRDHFTLERLNRDTDKMESVTFERGEYVRYQISGNDNFGEIDGISHSRREFSVDGLWYPFGFAYKAERPAVTPDEDAVPLSSVIDDVNAKHGEGLDYADRIHTLAVHKDLFSRVYEGNATADELKASFNGLLKNKDAIIAELNGMTKPKLFEEYPGLAYRYKNDKKDVVVEAVYRNMMDEFTLDNSISYSFGEKYENVIRRIVDNVSDEELTQFAEKVKRSREERKAALAERTAGMQNPQTLEDYTNLLRGIMAEGKTLGEARMTMTPEQREQYDILAAAKSRSERADRKNNQKTAVQATVTTTTGDIIETKHTKTGEDLFVVKAAERVERDVYNQWNTTAKRLGGWYSSFRGNGAIPGFQFKTRESAEAFLQYLGGDVEQAKEALQARRDTFADDRSQSAVERLTEMADKLEERADASLGQERKANTERRARFAASAEAAANGDKAMAQTMRNIASGIDNGTVQLLDQVRQKVQVEMLQGMVRTAHDEQLRKLYPSYADLEKHRGEKPTKEVADFVTYPAYTAYRSDLASLGRSLLETEGTKKLGQRIMSVADDVTDAYLKFARENLHKVSRFSVTGSTTSATFPSKAEAEKVIARSGFNGKAIVLPFKRGQNIIVLSPSEAMKNGIWEGDNDKRITLSGDFGEELVEKLGKVNRSRGRNTINVPWQFENAYDKRKRLAGMGIETPQELRAAIREFVELREAPKEADKIKQMERAMIGRRNDGLDFFPTPASVADEMIESADLKEGMAVLEPSAGMGHIADRIREAGIEPDVVELSGDRRELLEAKGYNVVGHDFIGFTDNSGEPGNIGAMREIAKDIQKSKAKSEKLHEGQIGRLHAGMTRASTTTYNARAGQEAEYRKSKQRELSGLVREAWIAGLNVPSDIVSEAGSGVEYDVRGNYAPIAIPSGKGYDRIIMNPPFGDRRDAAHVQHAYSLLKPGGRIVAIMGEGVFFGQDKKAQAFRDWLEQVGATDEKLEEGTFLDPSLPVNTGVNARMVVIDKADDVKFSRGDTQPSGITLEQFKAELTKSFGEKTADKLIESGVIVPLKDQTQLPLHVVPFLRTGDIVFGFYDPKTNRTYAVLENLTPDMIKGLTLHEVGTHYGFKKMLGESKYKEVMNRLDTLRRAGSKEIKKAHAEASANAVNEKQVPEETLAYLVQNHPTMSIIKDVIARIKTFLFREFGIAGKYLNEDDLTMLAKAAVNYAAWHEQQGSIESRSQKMQAAFQRVWHGSPHIFDKFSLDAIGTGEGAQAYGWGLYFAGKKEIAEHYRKGLTTRDLINKARDAYDESFDPDEAVEALLAIDGLSDAQRELILALQEDSWLGFDYPHQAISEAIKRPDQWDLSPRARAAVDKQGQLYEVEIPEDDTFLLWDKPLSEQSKKVIDAIDEFLGGDISYETLKYFLDLGDNATGKDFYTRLKQSFFNLAQPRDAEAASKYLHSLGINGIKYLDGSSRNAGDGSYNYVLFDDNAADIIQTHYSRENRQPSSASGDTLVTAAMEFLARDPELFQRPLTEVKDIYGIAKEIDPGYRVERLGPSMTKDRKADRAWEVFVPGSNVRSGVIMTNYDEVWIDVSRLQSGLDSGSAIYDMAAAYAHNNGKVLIGDPLGLSRMAYYRRNENMLSSALKYGTTRHLRPHLAQEIPSEYFTGHEKAFGESVRPLNWIEGDDVNNIREMIYNSWKAAIDNVPELKDVIYDPATQQFQYVDGRPFTDQDSERIAAELSRASRPYRAGSATQKRAALFNTFLRSDGREGRKQVLGALVDQLSRGGLAQELKGVFYSRSNRTQTPEFKKWFGDSKVIDANGNPLVVYHGTGAKFDAFVKSDGGTFGDGIYLTKSKEAAQEYADTVGGESNVMELYVSIKNPAPEDIASNVESRFGPGTSSELRRMGYDGIMAGDDIVAFRPEQIKSAIGNNGDFDGNNSNILFSRQGSFNPSWDAPEPSKFDNLIYTLQDKNIDLKRVTQEIQKAGNEIDDRWNAYLQEELYHGRTAKRTQDFIREELDPLVADMQERKVTMADFEEYLWMRHAEERNEQIAKVNPEMPDSGSGVSTAEAQEYLDSLSEDKRADFEALAARIDAINGKSRQLLIDYGLESRSTIKAWQDTYQHYVPLMREEMDHGFGNGTGQGFSVRGNSAKRATGSKRAVVDILANIAMQREKNIIRGEKNRVATALIGLAKLNPNPEFWNTDTVPQIKDIGKDGLVTYRPDPNYKGRENVIVARIVNKQGKIVEHSVIFNQFDERAQRMAASLKNLDQDQIGELLGVASSFTRYFASINTQYNPVFGAINITRDVQGALFNLESTPLAGKQKEVTRLTGSALKGIYQEIRAVRKGKKAETKWAQLWEEFQKEGGKTGFRDMYRNAKMRGEALEHAIDPEWWQKEKWGRVVSVGGVLAAPQQWLVSKPGKALFDWLSDYNDTLENSVRLAAYKVALDQGLSKQQSASIAKNLTVNFNRKGEMGRQIGSLYAFFNASVQGTARIGETLFKEGKMTRAGKQIIGGGMLLGGMQALMLAFAGYDDDEPPEFVRDRNLVIPLDWINDLGGPDLDDKYFTIPMPLGYNAVPATGRILTEWAMDGFDNTQHRFAHLLEVYMDMFNPIGYSGISMQTLAPTALDPFAALAENKDWTGMPIAREDFSSLNPTPGFTRSKDTASSISKGMSYSLNWLTGGTDFTPGIFSPTPDQIDYLIGQFTGGVGREYMKLEQTASSMVTGDELPTYKIPLVGRFYGNASGQTAQGGKFYDNLIRMNKHSNEIKGRMENGGDVDAYLAENPEAELADYATSTYNAISKLRKQRNQAKEEGSSKSELKEIDQDITDLMREFNDEVRKIKDGAPA